MSRASHVVQDPPLAKALFDHPLAGWLWVLPRIWLGWQWVQASEHKISDPAQVQTGAALKGFWAGAIAIPATGKPAISFVWYRAFLEMLLNAYAYTWFAKAVAYGELLIGVALIVGAFTGIAAFMGGFMNWNFMMAGSASVNPVFFVISVGLILAQKVYGYIGADHLLLPWVGTPWGRTRGEKARKANASPAPALGD